MLSQIILIVSDFFPRQHKVTNHLISKKTMKKTYQTPSTELMLINIENLLQNVSPTTLPKGGDGDDDTVTDKNELLGRSQRNVWDDEEEEDY